MANLDYTNIAGSPLQPYVAKQIERRKELVKKQTRTPAELQWLTNKNAWIRVSSGANVDYDNNRFGSLHGDELSKKYILQGGLLNHQGGNNSYKLRSGIGPDGAYGIGDNSHFGIKPMPGITNMSVGTGGKLGTLKEITIDFMCYNMEQLNIMEALYMKLGFGVLVEWGHTYYINNDTGVIQNNPEPIGFYGIHTKEDLMEAITTQRKKHFGNYDASWGTIKNFTYSLSDNGSFKCQIKLVGAGDILESLKINLSGEYPKNETTFSPSSSAYPVVSDANESLLNSALYNIYSKDVVSGDNVEFQIDTDDAYIASLQPYLNNLNINMSDWDNNVELVRKGYNYRLINTPGMNQPHDGDINGTIPEIVKGAFFGRLVVGFEIDGTLLNENDISSKGLEQVYITLGHLLLLVKANGMLYQKSKNGDTKSQKPYIYIDVNPDTNLCYTFPGHCSLDPSVCLIGSDKLPFGIISTMFDNIRANFPFYELNGTRGRFMHTLVNIDWVTSILKKYRGASAKGDVNFVDFIQDILTGISKATGGFNDFRIVPDDDTRCIRILDDQHTANAKTPGTQYTEIPVLGTHSLAYDFSYTSKISPNMAAMITIAAQAQPYGVQGSKNALAFSHLNKGLYNRLETVTVDAANENNQKQTTDSASERYIALRTHIEAIYNGFGGVSAAVEEETDEIEKKVTKNREGSVLKELSPEDLRKLMLNKLEIVYQELINQTTKTPVTTEKTSLRDSYNIVRKEWLSDPDLIKKAEAIVSFDGKTASYLDANVYNAIHDALEDEYESVNIAKDTEIEAIWTGIAQKQTGKSWKTFY
jgi:hypothetical protein